MSWEMSVGPAAQKTPINFRVCPPGSRPWNLPASFDAAFRGFAYPFLTYLTVDPSPMLVATPPTWRRLQTPGSHFQQPLTPSLVYLIDTLNF